MRSYVLSAFVQYPWAILPEKLAALEDVVVRHVKGEKLSEEEIELRIHGSSRPPERMAGVMSGGQSKNNVAILPLFGSIFPRGNMMTRISGATSTEDFGRRFSELVNDPNVSAIVLDVNSPGGQVGGVEELSQRIYDARGKKPIVAVVNHLMASAAYWIGTSADEVVITPSGSAGSIGVFAVHEDISRALENEGVKVSIIRAGKYKAEGNPYEPLSEEARASLQADVDDIHDRFIEAVARNRNVKASYVRSDFGEGRVVNARQAVARGMADRIGTLDDTVNSLLASVTAKTVGARRADSDPLDVSVAAVEPESSTGETAEDDTAREAKRLRDYLDVYK